MDAPSLIALTVSALTAVFVLLAIIAAVMYFITLVFPQRQTTVSAAHVAAICTAARAAFPGGRVVRIEEVT
jgi:hypothetical protein